MLAGSKIMSAMEGLWSAMLALLCYMTHSNRFIYTSIINPLARMCSHPMALYSLKGHIAIFKQGVSTDRMTGIWLSTYRLLGLPKFSSIQFRDHFSRTRTRTYYLKGELNQNLKYILCSIDLQSVFTNLHKVTSFPRPWFPLQSLTSCR